MPEPFVVEIWGKPAGVVLKEHSNNLILIKSKY